MIRQGGERRSKELGMAVETIGVVGAGLMGAGIVEQAAKCGYQVVVREVNDEVLNAGRKRIDASMTKAVDAGKLLPEDRDAAVGRIRGTTALDDLRDCDIVVEAIVENLEAKQDVFRGLDRITAPEAILTSNTSSVSITAL